MYIFANRDLGMSPGKLAAQASHAAVEAYRISKQEMLDAWYVGGHYAKLVMLAEDTEHLRNIKHYLEARGFKTVLIVDEGRTEIAPHSATALGVEVVDKDDEHTAATFGDFRTYREKKPPQKKGLLHR
jgi:PTH2 family peptidyl-tRNA hydrolase